VSDPTQQQVSIELTIANTRGTRVKGEDAGRIRLTPDGDGVKVVVNTRDLAGATVEFEIHR
jgi:hypothetical protein